MAHPGGRPRHNSPEGLAKAVERMIREYEDSGDISALHDIRLMQILGNISPRTLERYYDGSADRALEDEDAAGMEDDIIPGEDNNNMPGKNSTKQRYGDAMKKLVAYRQRVCVQHIAEDRQVAGWIFLSKQPHWGGFQDVQRQEKTGVQEFKITISGPDGKPLRE